MHSMLSVFILLPLFSTTIDCPANIIIDMESMDFTDNTFVSELKPFHDGLIYTCLTFPPGSQPQMFTFLLPRFSSELDLAIVGGLEIQTILVFHDYGSSGNTFKACDIGASSTDVDGHQIYPVHCTCQYECTILFVKLTPLKWGQSITICESILHYQM